MNILFNSEMIEDIKKESATKISSNDLIHGTLLKIYGFNPFVHTTDNFCLGFPRNMRTSLGLGNEVIGNVVTHSKFNINKGKILASSISALAVSNRQYISKVSIDDFMKNLEWYRYFQKQRQAALSYMPLYNFLSCRVTNWTSFKYDAILFGDQNLLKLVAPCYAQFGVNIISFKLDNKQKSFKTTICIPTEAFKSIQRLGFKEAH